jgi:hypothetical protein
LRALQRGQLSAYLGRLELSTAEPAHHSFNLNQLCALRAFLRYFSEWEF